MYRALHQLLPVGRPLGKPKPKLVTRYKTPIGLSVNLSKTLQKSLYLGFYQYRSRAQPVSTPYDYGIVRTDYSCHRKTESSPSSLSCVFVRNVRIIPGESVSLFFSSENGHIFEPLSQGRMLLLTNQRVIAFGKKADIRETVIIPLEEIKAVTITAGQRSKGTLFQGGLMIVAAVVFYLALAYWLTGRIDGPQVPIIRMDLVAFIAFLVVLIGVSALAQVYFAKPDGEVTFQGDGVKFTFPFRGETSEDEMYALVNAAFAGRRDIAT